MNKDIQDKIWITKIIIILNTSLLVLRILIASSVKELYLFKLIIHSCKYSSGMINKQLRILRNIGTGV